MYRNDLLTAEKGIIISSPAISGKKVYEMIYLLVDHINNRAFMKHIRRGYLEDFIRESNRSLIEELNVRSLEDLLVSEEVAEEKDEGIAIKNIGLLMFGERPDKLIAGSKIELVRFHDKEAEASDFTEKTFYGPIWKQVRDADRTYMITTIRIHEGFETENENFAQKNKRSLSEVLRQKDYDKVRTIVNFMEEHGEITPKEVENISGKSAATVRRYFKILADTRYIVAEGSTNNIVYRISMNLSEDD